MHGHVVGNPARGIAAQEVGHGEQIGIIRLRLVLRGRVAGEQLQRSGRMAAASVRHGTDDREAVSNLSLSRQQLTNLQTRHARRNRLVRPTILAAGQRLGIVGFQMAGTAPQPNENQRRSFMRSRCRPCAQSQQLGQAQTAETQAQKLSPGGVRESRLMAALGQHFGVSDR